MDRWRPENEPRLAMRASERSTVRAKGYSWLELAVISARTTEVVQLSR